MRKQLMLFMLLLFSVTLISCNKKEFEYFSFQLIDIDNNLLVDEKIKYNNNSVISSLEAVVDLDIQIFDIGSFINGVNNFYPTEYKVTYNYYFSLYVNDELSEQGIDLITYSKDLKIVIKEETILNEQDFKVDQVIKNLTNKIDINKNIDYTLFASLIHLNNYGYNYLALDNYQTALDFETINSSFKSVIYNQVMNKEISPDDLERIKNFEINSQWDYPNYLNLLNIVSNNKELMLNLANTLMKENLSLDSDTIAMIIISLSSLKDELTINNYIDELVIKLAEEVGISAIKGFNGENLASTAQALLALIATGKSKDSLEGIDLVESILGFYTENGFKNKIDGEVDLMFATPQGLASLIVYKIQRDQLSYQDDKSLNIFGFNYES